MISTTDPPFIVDYEFGGQGGSRSVFLADGDGTFAFNNSFYVS